MCEPICVVSSFPMKIYMQHVHSDNLSFMFIMWCWYQSTSAKRQVVIGWFKYNPCFFSECVSWVSKCCFRCIFGECKGDKSLNCGREGCIEIPWSSYSVTFSSTKLLSAKGSETFLSGFNMTVEKSNCWREDYRLHHVIWRWVKYLSTYISAIHRTFFLVLVKQVVS